MLITLEFFATFTNRTNADSSTTQVLIAMEVNSRTEVDEIIKLDLAHEGSRYRDGVDSGWMYYDSFADPDGHQWEVLYSDPSQITNP